MKEMLDQSKKLLTNGKLEQAILYIADNTNLNSTISNELILLHSRVKKNEDDRNKNFKNSDDHSVEKTKIENEFLNLLEKLGKIDGQITNVVTGTIPFNDFIKDGELYTYRLKFDSLSNKFAVNKVEESTHEGKDKHFHKLIFVLGNHKEGKSSIYKWLQRTSKGNALSVDCKAKSAQGNLNQFLEIGKNNNNLVILDNFQYLLNENENFDTHTWLENFLEDTNVQIIIISNYHDKIDDYSDVKAIKLKIKLLTDNQQIEFLKSKGYDISKYTESKAKNAFEAFESLLGIPGILDYYAQNEPNIQEIYNYFFMIMFPGSENEQKKKREFLEWLAFHCTAERWNGVVSQTDQHSTPTIKQFFEKWQSYFNGEKNTDSRGVKRIDEKKYIALVREVYYFFHFDKNAFFSWKPEFKTFFALQYIYKNVDILHNSSRSKYFTWGLACFLEEDGSFQKNSTNLVNILLKENDTAIIIRNDYFKLLENGWLYKDYDILYAITTKYNDSRFLIPPLLGFLRLWILLRKASVDISRINASKTLRENFIQLLCFKGLVIDRRKDIVSTAFELDLSNINLSEYDFSFNSLKFCTFINSNMEKANFSNCNLNRVHIEKSNIQECIFDTSNMEDSYLLNLDIQSEVEKSVSFKNTRLINSKLEAIKISKADFSEADFYQSEFLNVEISRSDLPKTNFTNARFDNFVLSEVDAQESQFLIEDMSFLTFQLAENPENKNVQFTKVDFSKSCFKGFSFKNVEITNCVFIECDLRLSNLSNKFISNDLSDIEVESENRDLNYMFNFELSNFSDAILDASIFVGIKLNECKFFGTSLLNTCFQKCEFRNTWFSCSLKKVKFENCILKGANFFGSFDYNVESIYEQFGSANDLRFISGLSDEILQIFSEVNLIVGLILIFADSKVETWNLSEATTNSKKIFTYE